MQFSPRFRLFALVLGWASALSTAGASAVEFQAPTSIDAAVAAYLDGEGGGDSGVPVDARLHLKACADPLDIARRGDRSLEVGCGAEWRIFVRTEGAEAPVPAAAQDAQAPLVAQLRVSLARGSMITASDIEMVPVPGRMAADTVRSVEMASGLKLRRSVMPGTVLRLSMLERAPLIMRGDRVSLRADGPNFAVAVEAEAIENGSVGDRVTVRNLSSGEKIQGRVAADGSVLISS
ncbi:flagellar basal body P-ring formation chaperone FlgA [Pacificimonas flava]|uniref:Flagella basal body P-ring formation protein FlgA n=1 Tax=Pacificimonas flava TaxID=1234595 RepID=M2TC14_9SPHN|nr:flagellar basal body P-ring formation chaperone FlgA [Pacificimonas flava]EMD84169.1 Flagellar basal-body P-ring formation protein FlgA [Pacificimonas flava]MBB5279953.1 flagella basal body P-ring formation protein FlgA [Pacificimonas flava]